MSDAFAITVIVVLSLSVGVMLVVLLRRKGREAPLKVIRTETLAERVRAVGKLVGLEVHAKEIATSTKGWSWVPPLLLSQAKIAMIFHFEKQYFVDLTRIGPKDVVDLGGGRFKLHLPAIGGTLRLTDVTPYDIQAGRVLGLIDVIQMNAQTQNELMRTAQDQAAQLYEKAETRYVGEAQRSIERQLASLLELFDAQVQIDWSPALKPQKTDVAIEQQLENRLVAMASSA